MTSRPCRTDGKCQYALDIDMESLGVCQPDRCIVAEHAQLFDKTLVNDTPEWKDAVIEKLVVCHIYTAEHESDPEKAINDLISYHVGLALDPAVSEPMAQLQAVASAANTLFSYSEEYEFDDGLGRGAILEYWQTLDEALMTWIAGTLERHNNKVEGK